MGQVRRFNVKRTNWYKKWQFSLPINVYLYTNVDCHYITNPVILGKWAGGVALSLCFYNSQHRFLVHDFLSREKGVRMLLLKELLASEGQTYGWLTNKELRLHSKGLTLGLRKEWWNKASPFHRILSKDS